MSTERWAYARRDSRGRIDIHTESAPDGARALVVVDPYHGSADVTPIAKIAADLPVSLTDVDALVFREVDFGEPGPSGLAAEVAALLKARSGRDVEIGTLTLPRAAPRRLGYLHGAGPSHGIDRLVDALCAMEIRALIERSGAAYRPAGAHVLLPSGDHADVYLRVADVFDDPVSIVRMADWLDHRVTPNTILLADTWTILPLMQELSRRHGQPAANGRDPTGPPIHSLVQYPDADEVRQVFERLAGQAVSRPDGVLAIISVVSSGALVENLQRLHDRYLPGVPLRVVTIVNTNTVAVDSLSTFREIRRYSVKACPLCETAETQPLVSIDSKRYFPSFIGKRTPVMITPDAAGRHRRFWNQANRAGAVSVHADVSLLTGDKRDIQHREIAVDVIPLLGLPEFREATLDALAKCRNRCDVVVIPNHGAAESLERLARELYPSPPLRVVRLDVPWGTTGRAQLVESVSGARHILILDDSVVTGRTVRLIHRLIQDVIRSVPKEQQPQRDYDISAFAVIGRPQNKRQWDRLQDSLRQAPGTQFLNCRELIFMPDGPCPWCDERDRIEPVVKRWRSTALYGRTGAGGDSDAAVEDLERRLAILTPIHGDETSRDRIRGLASALFLCGEHAELGPRDAESLTWHSLFGDELGEATTYAAVAVAMHELRLKSEEALANRQAVAWEWDWAAQRILTGYHDPLIQASFLRAARAAELRFARTPELELAVDEAFFSIGSSTRAVSPMLAAEHKLAALAQKYTPRVRELIITKANEALLSQASRAGDEASRLLRLLDLLQRELILSSPPGP